MTFSTDLLDEIKARLPVSTVVRRRVVLKKAGREWRGLSPFNNERSPSFFVNDQKAFWHDFSSGRHGDVFAFMVEVEGLSFQAAVTECAAIAGVPVPDPRPAGSRPQGASASPPQRRPDPALAADWERKRAHREAIEAAEEARKAAEVEAIWSGKKDKNGNTVEEGSEPIEGTPGWAYMLARGIDLSLVPDHGGLRFHPQCKWGDGTAPCVVARFTDAVTNEPRGIWRRRTDIKAKPMTLGRMAGCVIRLWADDLVEQGLVIGEGVETVLSAATQIVEQATVLAPAWAACGTANLASFPVLPGVQVLTILADRDESGAGAAAAKACAERWAAAGREVTILTPRFVKDFNDLTQEG
jgi:CHC2 zinc finger/Toprim domain